VEEGKEYRWMLKQSGSSVKGEKRRRGCNSSKSVEAKEEEQLKAKQEKVGVCFLSLKANSHFFPRQLEHRAI
jgi:hypothetical protein